MDDHVLREITRASAGVGYRTRDLDRIAVALNVTRDPMMIELIALSVLDLIAEGKLMAIKSAREHSQRGCYVVPADYAEPYLPGYFTTPWEACEPFGLPAIEPLD